MDAGLEVIPGKTGHLVLRITADAHNQYRNHYVQQLITSTVSYNVAPPPSKVFPFFSISDLTRSLAL